MFDVSGDIWIGAYAPREYDSHEISRPWFWVESEIPFLYSNWNPGEPNNSEVNEYCKVKNKFC